MEPLLDIDMPPYEDRRRRFNELLNPESFPPIHVEADWTRPARFACDCCGFPTILRPWYFEMCTLCEWEDDECSPEENYGGGPNGPYTLFESRANFERYGCMYGPDEVHRDFAWNTTPEVLEAKRRLIGAYLLLLEFESMGSPEAQEAWRAAVAEERGLIEAGKRSREAIRRGGK